VHDLQTQLVLLAILSAAILNFAIGTVIPRSEEQVDKGFHGYDGKFALSQIVIYINQLI